MLFFVFDAVKNFPVFLWFFACRLRSLCSVFLVKFTDIFMHSFFLYCLQALFRLSLLKSVYFMKTFFGTVIVNSCFVAGRAKPWFIFLAFISCRFS